MLFSKKKKSDGQEKAASRVSLDEAVFGAPSPQSQTAPESAAALQPAAARVSASPGQSLPIQPATRQATLHELHLGDLSTLEGVQTGDALGTMSNGRYVVGRYEGGRSKQSLDVAPGDVVFFETDVRLDKGATTKSDSYFVAGCLFLDASGHIVQWWDAHAVPDANGRSLLVRAVAPESAATVKAGVHGTWAADGSADDCVISYGRVVLRKAF